MLAQQNGDSSSNAGTTQQSGGFEFSSSPLVYNSLYYTGTFASGAADFMTFGLTKKINEMDGGASSIGYDTSTYTAGKFTGIGLEVGMAATAIYKVGADIAKMEAGELFGTRFGGNQPLLNNNDFLRIGWSYIRANKQYVFRIGGTAVGWIKSNPHINLWPPSWWFK